MDAAVSQALGRWREPCAVVGIADGTTIMMRMNRMKATSIIQKTKPDIGMC
jgi:hypothetical protein